MPSTAAVPSEATRESRARRAATKYGYAIRKSRSRTWHCDDHGGYRVVDLDTNTIVSGEKFDLSLDKLEAFLTE